MHGGGQEVSKKDTWWIWAGDLGAMGETRVFVGAMVFDQFVLAT
jgi:hypothetical protein